MSENTAPVLTGTLAALGPGSEDVYYPIYSWDTLAGYTDADADLLAVSDMTADHGTLVPSPYGSGFVFHPATNFYGSVTVRYNVIDGSGGITAATQSFMVQPVNDNPALTGAQAVLSAGIEDTPYVVRAADLLTGFSDVDGDALSISYLNTNSGDVIDNGNGTFTVMPFSDHYGEVSLSYGVVDGNGGVVNGLQSFSLEAANDSPSFGIGDGKAFLGRGDGNSLALLEDGKILLGGTDTESVYQFSFTRFNSDGSLDNSFFDHGKLVVDLGAGSAKGQDIAVQADGTVFLAGSSTLSPFSADGLDFAVLRVGYDGTVGAVIQPVNTAGLYAADEGSSVALQADGKILVAGTIQKSLFDSDFGVIRLNVDGSLDTTFGQGGKVIQGLAEIGLGDYANDMAVQADGKIVVVGSATKPDEQYDFGVMRLNIDGSLDSSFGHGGKLLIDVGGINLNDHAYSIVIQPDSKLLIAGTSWDGNNGNFSLVRLNADGNLDHSFGSDGKLLVDVGEDYDMGKCIALQADGKILMAGSSRHNGTEASGGFDISVIRLNSDGILDSSFNGSGKVVIPSDGYSNTIASGNYHYYASSIALQEDGKILIGGNRLDGMGFDQGVIRLNADGSVDTTFDLNILNGVVSYVRGGSPVVLDSDVTIYDKELSGGDNFSGASLTLSRHGGADIHDIFSAGANLRFSDGHVFLSDIDIGTVSIDDGILAIIFGANATQARVNETLSSITYANDYISTPSSIQLDWNFSDGNNSGQGIGGALVAVGSSTVNIGDNHSPLLNTPVADQVATIGSTYTITLPSTVFTDPDAGDVLSYSAIQADGNALPPWLHFDSTTRTFSGTPGSADYGDLSIHITATDAFSETIGDEFNIRVAFKLTGTAGKDFLNGTAAYDVIEGLAGKDILDGGLNADILIGGEGNDIYLVDDVGDVVIETSTLSTEIDVVKSAVSFDLGDQTQGNARAQIENLTLTGSADLAATGNAKANVILGNNGANLIDGSDGTDTLKGGKGDDIYLVDLVMEGSGVATTIRLEDALVEKSKEGTDTVLLRGDFDNATAASVTLANNLEYLDASGTGVSRLNLNGNRLINTLAGNDADNVLDGKAGADTMLGGAGNDTYFVGSTGDVVDESDGLGNDAGGNDLVKTTVSYTLGAYLEDLTLLGTGGINGTGNSIANGIVGNAGANTLDGQGGADTLSGERGNDTYVVDNQGDVVIENANAGTDLVRVGIAAAGGTYILGDHLENATLINTVAYNLTGNSLANTLTGNTEANVLDGGTGTDKLIGGGGNDTYVVDLTAAGRLDDRITEAAYGGIDTLILRGASTNSPVAPLTLANNLENIDASATGLSRLNLTGNGASNLLIGNDWDNVLKGLDGNDTLSGGAGNDLLIGGALSDFLTGGADADIFKFETALNGATDVDTILDFGATEDTIQLESAIFNKLTVTGALSADNFRAENGVSAQDGNDYILYDTLTGALFYDPDGSGTAQSAQQFATLIGIPSISSVDFSVI